MFDCDWTEFYTPEEAEEQLRGFKFEGLGWYETETDTLLVLDRMKAGKHNGRYKFICWNYPGARIELGDRLSRILHMPRRKQ